MSRMTPGWIVVSPLDKEPVASPPRDYPAWLKRSNSRQGRSSTTSRYLNLTECSEAAGSMGTAGKVHRLAFPDYNYQ